MKKQLEKRISFGFYEAAHLYELAMEHMCKHWENCGTCSHLQARLDKYLGKKEVAAIKKLLRKNGYCNKLKNNNPYKAR